MFVPAGSELDWTGSPIPNSSLPSNRLMITGTKYTCELATHPAAVRDAQALRFQVFNMELDEGLDHSYLSNLDQDEFDDVCDHLIVRDESTRIVVGTYRFQSGNTAQKHLGYYSEQEFDLQLLEPYRPQVLELGRACIHREHRNISVLNLLWREIANYAKQRSLSLLIGCSSLTSQDPDYGLAAYELLSKRHLADAKWRTPPRPEFECHPSPRRSATPQVVPKIPKLLSAYLVLGAKIGGPPAIDREFKTIDFLTILDLDSLPLRVWRRYLS